MRIAVVLPAPLGPSSTVIAPSGTEQVEVAQRRVGSRTSRPTPAHARRRRVRRAPRSGAATCRAVGHGGHRSFIGRSAARTKRFPIQAARHRIHRRAPDLRAILVRVFVLGIDPGLSRCGYCVRRRGRSGGRGTARAVALGRAAHATPTAAVHLRLAELPAGAPVAHRRVPPVGAWRSSGCCSRSTCARPCAVGQASGVAMAEARRRGLRRRAVLARTRSRRPSPATAAPTRSRCSAWCRPCSASAAPPQPADAADAAALALCHLAHARRCAGDAAAALPAGVRGMIGSLRGTLLDRCRTARCWSRSAGVGYRVHGHADHRPSALGEVGGEVFLHVHHHVREDAETLYGFLTATSASCFEALHRRPRRRPDARPRHPLGAHARPRCARSLADRRRRRAVPGARGRQEDRGPPAGRAEVPSRRARPRRSADRRSPRSAGPGPASVRSPTCATPWPSLGYGPDEIGRGRCATCPTDGDSSELLRDALQRLAAGLMARDELLDAGARTRRRRAGRPSDGGDHRRRRSSADVGEERWPRCAPPRSTSSSARPSSRSTSAIILEAARRRGQAADHLLFAGPPGLGKTTLAGIVAAEMGVALHDHLRPRPRARRRPGRHPHQAGRGRRAVHRRDPPPAPHRRGGPLPGDGGLPARHRARQGPGGPLDPPRPAPLHAWSAPPPAPA